MLSNSQEKYLQATLARAASLLKLGRYDLAIPDLEEVYSWRPAVVAPLYAEALMQRGKKYEKDGDPSKALEDYSKAAQMPLAASIKAELDQAVARLQGRPKNPLSPISNSGKSICPNCGKETSVGWTVCPHCGYDLHVPGFKASSIFPKVAVDHAVLKDPVVIYQDSGDKSAQVAQLNPGDEVKLGALKRKGKNSWVAVTLPDGRKGFLPGTSRIFKTIKVKLDQDRTSVLAGPSINSPVKFNLDRNEKFYILDSSDGWARIHNLSGLEGFLNGQAKTKKLAAVTREVAQRNMVSGALWCIGGILVTCISYSAVSSSGGTYLITWGAIIFGAIQFFQGLGQYQEASSDG